MMKRTAVILMALMLLALPALAQGELTAYETRCGYGFQYDAALFSPIEAGAEVLLQPNKPAYFSYIDIRADRTQHDDPDGIIQQAILDSGCQVDESTYRAFELPAETKAYAARFPYMDGAFECAIVHQAGMEFVINAYYDSQAQEALYSGAFDELLRSLSVNPNGDVSGFEDKTEIYECEAYVSDPYMNAVELYAGVIHPFARMVSGMAWHAGDMPSDDFADAYAILVKDLNGDGMFDLALLLYGDSGEDDGDEEEPADAVCCLYTFDEENDCYVDWLPGMGAMYSYTLLQAADGSPVLRRAGRISDTSGIEVCHFYRFGADGPAFIEGYIMDGMTCYAATDDSLVVSADAREITFDEIEEMEGRYVPYSLEDSFVFSASEYFYLMGDSDANEAWLNR